jgi:DNA repair protein RecO (recombination protein O)
MEWSDQGIVLSASPHGETSSVARLLTRDHGRHAGLVQGGQGRLARSLFQPGNLLSCRWRGRLADHLGRFTCELEEAKAALLLEDADRLACLRAATAISDAALPEREPHPECFEGLLALLDGLSGDHWGEVYVHWELSLLAALGFGLDLSACAATGSRDDLAYVSPKSGRAVSRAAGAPYKERLLGLPGFLIGKGGGGRQEVSEGLSLTGFFLQRHVFAVQHKAVPAARDRLAQRLEPRKSAAPVEGGAASRDGQKGES